MTGFLVVAAVQGLAIFVDEVFFHRKRGLPKWERISHPIDTMTVILCLLYLVFMPRTPTTETIYYVMVGVSSILVTKDEWEHRKFCTAEEMWLHAVLFLMHPLVLLTAMTGWGSSPEVLLMVSAGIFCFLAYQIVYWGFLEPKLRQHRQNAHYSHQNQDELYEYFSE